MQTYCDRLLATVIAFGAKHAALLGHDHRRRLIGTFRSGMLAMNLDRDIAHALVVVAAIGFLVRFMQQMASEAANHTSAD